MPATVISNSSGETILDVTQRLSYIDVLMGEAFAALLSSRLVASTSAAHFLLEGDALLVTLAVNQPLSLLGIFLLLFQTLD